MLADQLRKIVPGSIKRAATDHEFWFRSRLNVLARPVYSGIGSILAFHRVCEASWTPRLGFNADLEVTPQLLEQTIEFCKAQQFRFVSLDELHDLLDSGQSSQRFVAFTIDDGYADALLNAYPIFKRHNVPFAVYVTTCFPNRTAILWWYVLEDLVRNQNELEFEINGVKEKIRCANAVEKNTAFNKLAGVLTAASSHAEVQSILRGYDGDLLSPVKDLAMTWEQLCELAADPLVTIGAHSVNHLSLSQLSESHAIREVGESKTEIEKYTGKKVEHFAYPYGGRNSATARDFQLVKEAGFKTATTTRNGNIFRSHRHQQHCLPRIPVYASALKNDINYLSLWTDGLVSCHENSFQRVITV